MLRAPIHTAIVMVFTLFWAATALGDDPKALVTAKYQQIQKIIETEKTDQAVRAKLALVLESFTDFQSFGQRTLKRHWKELDDAQRKLFVDKFRLLIHKSYVKHFKANQELAVQLRGEPLVKGDKALVKTTVKSGKTTAEVDYKLHSVDGKHKAYDIVIDDVSLMRSYRKQFGKIYKRDGFKTLIEKMTRKIEKEDGELSQP